MLARITKEAEYIVSTGATVRTAAAIFGVSKSTVHKDVSERLSGIDRELYKSVKNVLHVNLSQRHIRGGMATKTKYEGRSRSAKKVK